jgi:Xaa-Pro aminopeptidase
VLHYDENTRRMREGEVVVMDVGAEYAGYAADVTRTLPVGGKYTRAQREIYETVRRAQHEAFGIIRPGLPWREIDRKAKDLIAAAGYGKYILHGVTHHLGLDVHDAGSMDTLRVGMVITVEPGIYIPANDSVLSTEYHGFGVRIEDDVLVTKDGCQVLSESIPRDPDEIESLLRK